MGNKLRMKERYRFFLSPYTDAAFTKCPKCEGKTKQKKIPLVIHLEKNKQFLSLNKTCRFCPYCELLIAKKHEIEQLLEKYLAADKLTGNDYFIMGTQERKDWLSCVSGCVDSQDALKTFFVFRNVWDFEAVPRWCTGSKEAGK